MDYEVREARAEDAERILPMFEWLMEPPGRRPATWEMDRARTALAEAIDASEAAVFVVEEPSGELIGLCTAYLDLHSIRFGPRCWIEDLVVAPDRRSRGVGSALLDAAADWARERGATHLELDTGLARTDAQRLYERRDPDAVGYTYSWALRGP